MERFGIALPLRNQYYIMRVGQSFSDKGGKVVTNPESCLLDWPMTGLGREQILSGAQALLESRHHQWASWKRINKLAVLTSATGGREISRRTKQSVLMAWRHIAKTGGGQGGKRRPAGGGLRGPEGRSRNKNAAPDEIQVYASDFKVAKQSAHEMSQLLSKDETVGTVSLQYSKLLRERSLGPGIEHGGFDGCSLDDLQQVYSLDLIDGSHTLGGVESCEQVLSRCMTLIRDIELSTQQRQILLLTHKDVAHILQTIFSGVRPGLHRRLPGLGHGEARELKFTVSALAAHDEAGGEDDDSCGGTRHRHVRLYLTGSAGMERQRDMLLQRVMPAISDLCHRRGGSLSVVDLRMTIEADHGLGTATIAHRLEALDGCNALVCLVDPAVEERRVLVSEDALAKMPSDKMLALLVEQLESGEAGMSAVQQWLKLTEVMGELLAAQQAIASQDELDKAKRKAGGGLLLRRIVEEAQQRGRDKARSRLQHIFPGLGEVVAVKEKSGHLLEQLALGQNRYDSADFSDCLRQSLEDLVMLGMGQDPDKMRKQQKQRSPGRGQASPGQVSPLRSPLAKGSGGGGGGEDDEGKMELELKSILKPLLWLAETIGRHRSIETFREEVELLHLRLEALQEANDKYPWVSSWHKASLVELEVRQAAMSSVPVIPRANSLFFQPKAAKSSGLERANKGNQAMGEEGFARTDSFGRVGSNASGAGAASAEQAAGPNANLSQQPSTSSFVRAGSDGSQKSTKSWATVRSNVKKAGTHAKRAGGGKRLTASGQTEGLITALEAEGIEVTSFGSIDELAELVQDALCRMVDALFPLTAVPDANLLNKQWHDQVASIKNQECLPDARLANILAAHLEGNAQMLVDEGVYASADKVVNGLVVMGAAGCGKSSLLASAGMAHRFGHRDDLVMMHFASSCGEATDPLALMRRIILECSGHPPPSVVGISTHDAAALATSLGRAFESAHVRRNGQSRVALLIDQVQVLSERDTNLDLWLPVIFPSTIRVILTAEDGEMADRRLASRAWSSVRVPTLDLETRQAICASALASMKRVFSRQQMTSAVGSPFTCRPLFLVTLAQQCRLCHGRELDESPSGEPILEELKRSQDMRQLYHNMLQHLHHSMSQGPTYTLLVPRLLALVWAGRRGLLESEILGILRMEPGQKIPQERLLLVLRHLEHRLVVTCGLVRIFHLQLREAVGRFCLGYSEAIAQQVAAPSSSGEVVHGAEPGLGDMWTPATLAAHRRVLDYFSSQVDLSLRKVQEMPWQLCRCIDAHAALAPLLVPKDWKPPPPAAQAALAAAKGRRTKSGLDGLAGVISGEGRLMRNVQTRVGPLLHGWDDGLDLEEQGRLGYLEKLADFLLDAQVLRELATVAMHHDLCQYWRYVCWQPGSLSQVANRYMSSLQGYVMVSGDKAALPPLVFAVGFMLEDLQQYRSAALVYMECVRTIEHLQLMHPLLLNTLRPNFAAQLIHMMPKVKLHLAFCQRKAGLLRQAQLTIHECVATVASNSLYEWARSEVYMQAALLAKERGHFAAAQGALDKALQMCAPRDVTAQSRVLDEMMVLFRHVANMALSALDLKTCQKMLAKERKAASTAQRLWTEYRYFEADEGSRPPSALVSMFRKGKRPQSAVVSSCHVQLSYDPRIPNQASNITFAFTWARNIDVGDVIQLELRQLRAGSDLSELQLDGPFAFDFTATWAEVTRVLTLTSLRAHSAFTNVRVTVTAPNGLRLPVKQGGVAVALKEEAVMEITKGRVGREALAFDAFRPQTGASSVASDNRPLTRGSNWGSRPTTQGSVGLGGSRPATSGSKKVGPEGQDFADEDEDGMTKGSLDAARLLSRKADILSLQAQLQDVKHKRMLDHRDEWLRARHAQQSLEVKGMLSSQHDARLEHEVMSQLQQEQTNEQDAAHIVYENQLSAEREALDQQVEEILDKTLLMQTWLLGDGHPCVTDTLMITARTLMARQDFVSAVPILVRVWEIRTGSDRSEHLALGHPREVECSLFHVGRQVWLQGNMKGAVVLLEALLKNSERHKRNVPEVKALLAMAHVSWAKGGLELPSKEDLAPQASWPGHLMDLRIGLVASILEHHNMRPLSLAGSRLAVADVLAREGALIPDTVVPLWRGVALALALNHVLHELDLSDCDMRSSGLELLCPGLEVNRALHTLALAKNSIGVKGAECLRKLVRANASLTALDLSSNGLQDKGLMELAHGIADTRVYNTSLRSLRLANNAMTADAADVLSRALKMHGVKISLLDVSLNPIGSEGISHLVDVIFLGQPVVSLIASDCQIGTQGMIKIAEAVEVSTSLCSLCLSNTRKQVSGGQSFANKIDSVGVSVLAEALAQSYTLTKLDLSGCEIGVKGVKSMSDALKPLKSWRSASHAGPTCLDYMSILSTWDQRALFAARGTRGALRCLTLGSCKLGPEGAEALKHMLLGNPALVGLDLNQSGIMGTGLAHIAIALGANPKYESECNTTLTWLNLQCCEAYAVGATHVAGMLKYNNHLRRLNLSDNSIGPVGATVIAQSLAGNMALQHLDLAKNRLGEDGAVVLGSSLAENKTLSSLDVSHNHVGDRGATSLSRGIWVNKSLTYLNLSENRDMSALGAWYLTVAANWKQRLPGGLPLSGLDRRLSYVGLLGHEQVQDQLPRILSSDDYAKVVSMTSVELDLSTDEERFQAELKRKKEEEERQRSEADALAAAEQEARNKAEEQARVRRDEEAAAAAAAAQAAELKARQLKRAGLGAHAASVV